MLHLTMSRAMKSPCVCGAVSKSKTTVARSVNCARCMKTDDYRVAEMQQKAVCPDCGARWDYLGPSRARANKVLMRCTPCLRRAIQ